MSGISLILPIHGVLFTDMLRATLAAERAGLQRAWVPDHLINASRPARGVIECWTALAGLAAATRKIGLGTLVLTTGFRQPAILAKQVATLDSMAPGRLNLGLGSGGFTYGETCRQFGIPEMTPGARVAHCRDTVECLRSALTKDPASHTGRFTRTEGLRIHPRPASPVPVTIAARRPGMLRLAAELADGWNCPLPQELEKGLAALDESGRPRGSIHVSTFSILVTGKNDAEAARALDRAGSAAQIFGDVETHHLYGPPQRIAEGIRSLASRGADEIALDIRGAPVDETVEFLAERVLPLLG